MKVKKTILGTTLALALAAVLAGCGQTSGRLPAPGASGGGTAGGGPVVGSGSLPAELVGQWITTTAGGTIYVTPGGSVNGPSGTGALLAFTADGRYSETGYQNVALYNCNTGWSGHVEGAASVTGEKISLKPVKASLRQWATCGGKDYTKDLTGDAEFMQGKTRTLDYEVTEDPDDGAARLLTLYLPDGREYATLRPHR
jgi:hypothetical protein